MHEHGPFEQHRLSQGLERIGKYHECLALKLPQFPQLALPVALAKLGFRQNYSLACRIAPPGKGERVPFLTRENEYENFGWLAHLKNAGEKIRVGALEAAPGTCTSAGGTESKPVNPYL